MKTISSRLTEFYRKISLEYYYQKIPVIRALFAIGTYFWLAVILFFYGIRRRRAEIWNSWLLVLALCLTVFLGPISLVRYYLLLFYAAPAGIFLLADRPWQIPEACTTITCIRQWRWTGSVRSESIPERGEGHGDVRLGTPYDKGSETSLGVLCETQCTWKRRSTA